MKRSTPIFLGVAAIILLIIAGVSVASVRGHKKLVGLQESVDARWSDVAKEYQVRDDLIPGLIHALSAKAGFDKAALTELSQTQKYVEALQADTNHAPADSVHFRQYAQGEQALTQAVSRVLMATFKDPSLRSDKNLRGIEAQVLASENRLAIVQSRYDQIVALYNTTIQQFPMSIEAALLRLKSRDSFQAQNDAVAAK